MLTMTMWSLILAVAPWAAGLLGGHAAMDWSAAIALILLFLAALVVVEGLQAFALERPASR